MAGFDWQTDDDDSVSARQLTTPVNNKKRRIFLFLTIVALVSAGTVTYWNFNRQAEQRAQKVRMDVLAAYRLWQLADTRKDPAILDAVLEGGDPTWTIIQRHLLDSDLLINREIIGLSANRGYRNSIEISPTVELNPDWQSAQVIFQQPYTINADQPTAREIIPEQSISLKWTGSRWIVSDPGEQYWGEWETVGSEHIILHYPEKEKHFASRLIKDLEKALREVCSRHLSDEKCPDQTLINIRLENDPNILFRLGQQAGPIFREWTYLLPAPSLLGLPVDEEGYEIIFSRYADRIFESFATSLSSPSRLPNQTINIICYQPDDPLPRLFQYEIARDSWSQVGGDSSYQYLVSNADDSAVLAEEFFPGIANQVRFELWQYGSNQPVFDENVDPGWLVRLGWSESLNNHFILLQTVGSNPGISDYQLLDLARCSGGSCTTQDLEGLPLWSPDGLETVVQSGDQLYFGDQKGQLESHIGRGYNPFWLEEGHIGFTRYENRDGILVADLVQAEREVDGFSLLLSAEQIIETFDGKNINPVYIEYVQVVPQNRNRLLIYGRQYATDGSLYHIFLTDLEESYSVYQTPEIRDIRKLMTLNNAPAGYPSTLSTSGSAPFVVSPNGRWLTVSWLEDRENNLWQIQLLELDSGETKFYSTRYPVFTFKHPFYDWSRDGEWLVIADDGFLRLITPEYDYERIVGHGLNACRYPAWSTTATGSESSSFGSY